jgi:hypothetical protein
LATSFGLNRPSSGQYAPAFLSFFYKYCPDDGLFRPKLVAKILNNKTKDGCDRRSVYFV